MTRFSLARMLVVCLSTFLPACMDRGQHLTRPSATPNDSSMAADASAPGISTPTSAAEPPSQIQAILRGDGFGLVRFRQQRNATENIIDLDVWVRDLAPNSSYSLQRATDTTLDDVCTGSNWLTLGEGLTPKSIDTDSSGTGRAALFRDLSSLVAGTEFDIYFRVIDNSTNVVLQSDCYRFVIRD
jgi:hypothetical protein